MLLTGACASERECVCVFPLIFALRACLFQCPSLSLSQRRLLILCAYLLAFRASSSACRRFASASRSSASLGSNCTYTPQIWHRRLTFPFLLPANLHWLQPHFMHVFIKLGAIIPPLFSPRARGKVVRDFTGYVQRGDQVARGERCLGFFWTQPANPFLTARPALLRVWWPLQGSRAWL